MARPRKVKPFYIVVTDRDENVFNVLGPMTDDRPINHDVCAAQDAGRRVNCQTAGYDDPQKIIQSFKDQFDLEYTTNPII